MTNEQENIEQIDDTHDAKRRLFMLLQPCFTDPPTAGAVVIVNSEKGTEFFNINMDMLEMVTALANTSMYLQSKYCTHSAPQILQ